MEQEEVLEQGRVLTPTPGPWIMKTEGKRKVLVQKQDEKKAKKPRVKASPKMNQVARQCTNDVQTMFNWLAERSNMLHTRVDKHPERFKWEGFRIRFYTTVKMILFLDRIRDMFLSEEWFGEEVKMIQLKGWVHEKPVVSNDK